MWFNTNATHLQAQMTFLLQESRIIIVVSQLHDHICMYVCHSITHVDCSEMYLYNFLMARVI